MWMLTSEWTDKVVAIADAVEVEAEDAVEVEAEDAVEVEAEDAVEVERTEHKEPTELQSDNTYDDIIFKAETRLSNRHERWLIDAGASRHLTNQKGLSEGLSGVQGKEANHTGRREGSRCTW